MSKSQRRLNIEEREAISRGLAQGLSGAEIAAEMLRDASVVNREIARNGGRRTYRASKANDSAKSARGQKKRNKINDSPSLLAEICTLLLTGAAPKQIELALRRKHPHDLSQRVSHETIYDFIYFYAKGQLRKDLISHLRRKKPRRSPSPKARTKLSGQLPGAVNIAERPAEVALREVPGHWEADLVMGAGNRTAILVICERVTRFVMIVPLVSKDAASVCRALVRSFKQFPAHLRKTLTYDNGREMAHHLAFAMATDMKVYFCDPHSPWQRGSVENTNGLIREYFPKGTDFSQVTKGKIAKAEWCLNNRPRVALDGMTPNESFGALIHSSCALAS